MSYLSFVGLTGISFQFGRTSTRRSPHFLNPAPAPTTLAAFDTTLERRHLDIVGILRHVDQGLVATGVIETERDQMMHACSRMLPRVIGGPGLVVALDLAALANVQRIRGTVVNGKSSITTLPRVAVHDQLLVIRSSFIAA